MNRLSLIFDKQWREQWREGNKRAVLCTDALDNTHERGWCFIEGASYVTG